MTNPSRSHTILRGKLQDDDGTWMWCAIMEAAWLDLVPSLYSEVGVFELQDNNDLQSERSARVTSAKGTSSRAPVFTIRQVTRLTSMLH